MENITIENLIREHIINKGKISIAIVEINNILYSFKLKFEE
jgi:hypothetical protein